MKGRRARARAAKKLPRFRSDRDERAYWLEHSVENFAAGLEDLEVHPTRSESVAFLRRVEKARADIAAGRGTRLEDVPR